MPNSYPDVVDLSDESSNEDAIGAHPSQISSPPTPPSYNLKGSKRSYDDFQASEPSIVDLVDSDEDADILEIVSDSEMASAGIGPEISPKQAVASELTSQPRVREKTQRAISAFRAWVDDLSQSEAKHARDLRRFINDNFEDAKNKQAHHKKLADELKASGGYTLEEDLAKHYELRYNIAMRDQYLALVQKLGAAETDLCYQNFAEPIERHSILTENFIAQSLRNVHDNSRRFRELIDTKLFEAEERNRKASYEDSEERNKKASYGDSEESDSSKEPNDDNDQTASMSATMSASLQKILASAQKPVTPVNLPKEMKVTPMAHQRLGLGWLLSAEQGPNKGSILADDMGLGKTVQALSLVVANGAPPEPVAEGIYSDQTLIICPVSLLDTWGNEIKKHIDESAGMTFYIHHSSKGSSRSMTGEQIRSAGKIVITTYSTLLHEHKALQSTNSQRSSCLFGVHWWRIIMDEAHNIKNHKSKTAEACFELRAVNRLCLTGTPMQNKVAELWSLVKFLRIEPYWQDFAAFSRLLPPSFADRQADFDRLEDSNKKLHVFLASVLYRRTKTDEIDGQKILKNLTTKEVKTITVEMSQEERENYEAVEARVKKKASRFRTSEDSNQNYLSLITSLRMVTCHRLLTRITAYRKCPWADAQRNEIEAVLAAGSQAADTALKTNWKRAVCMKCKTPYLDQVDVSLLVPCCHHICYDCFSVAESDSEMISRFCEVCAQEFHAVIGPELFRIIRSAHFLPVESIEHLVRKNKKTVMSELKSATVSKRRRLAELKDLASFDLDSDFEDDDELFETTSSNLNKPLDINEVARLYHVPGIFTKGWVESVKITAVVDVIKNIITTNPTDKILLFSSFTSMLDLLSVPLQAMNTSFLTFTGEMNATKRSEVIDKFQNSAVKVLLISMKAGNTGLTLTEASHVIIAEPFWNPYVEEQAMDRAHRIGQLKPVTVYKIIVKGTIEDRIMLLQKQKKDAIDSALSAEGRDTVKRYNNQQLRFLLGF